MTTLASSFFSLFTKSPLPGEDAEHPLELTATPGLMTLLDLAMHRSVEGELTATICAGNALLQAWLDLKHQAQQVLSSSSSEAEQFARACLESASDAIEKLSTDRLAASANLTDAYESGTTSVLSGISQIPDAVAAGKLDSGRHIPLLQRSRDCWETARLVCLDHVWADEAYVVCQKHVRHLSKHAGSLEKKGGQESRILQLLVLRDIPMRLHQFRTAAESNAVVIKRLYLVKCEYRAPFRAFLEAHQTVQRAPSIQMVDEYLTAAKKSIVVQKQKQAEDRLQELLETPSLIQALALERECEMMEVRMAQALFPFTELARILDHKHAKLKATARGNVKKEDVAVLQDLLQRLKCLLCRKSGPETSTGIRPLLLDLQGVPRDESLSHSNKTGKVAMLGRLHTLVKQLELLGVLCKTRGAFGTDSSKRGGMDVPSAIAKDCDSFDSELFSAQCEDWYDMVQRQHELVSEFGDLAEQIRRAEMEKGISVASEASLGVVRQRLEHIAADREKRFVILKEIVEDVCRREMNWHVELKAPDKDLILTLPSTSVLGVFGPSLQMAGELLPIG